MHNLYIGTAKSIFHKVWVKTGVIDKVSLEEIHRRISAISIPANISFSRLPTPIETTSYTAEQWMVWVNYYSLFCLSGILPLDHIELWKHFVLASRLLCNPSLRGDDVSLVDALLKRFCCRFVAIYGPQTATPNMHMHCHLAECIRDFGTVSSFWLFSFERFNGILGGQPTNNRSIKLQPDCTGQFSSSTSVCISGDGADIDRFFRPVVTDHAFSFSSVRHLDMQVTVHSHSTSSSGVIAASKYTIGVFSDYHINVL